MCNLEEGIMCWTAFFSGAVAGMFLIPLVLIAFEWVMRQME